MGHPLVAGLISATAGWILFFLYRRFVGGRMNQAFRDAGPEHHKLKGKVPTGAGIVFVLAMLVCAAPLFLLSGLGSQFTLAAYICVAAALMGLLGFIDDRSKVLGGSAGLKARYKLPAMLLVGSLLLYQIHGGLATVDGGISQSWLAQLPLPVYYGLGLFIWLGAINGSNFTDGLDGLLGSTSLVVYACLLGIVLPLSGLIHLQLPVAVAIGVMLAYLYFNWKPASLYIGDSGSLCVGALVAGMVLASGLWLYLGLIAIIWVIEVLSVMIQVLYFKRTGGKRLFLMTPIHHHFELAGWKETHIVYLFSGFQAWGCLSAWLWLEQGLPWGLASSLLLLGSFIALVLRFNKRVA